ncbi:MAG: aminomethyltransferase beta-barrel domain-containing protein, partial [Pseudomonadota bacterium]
GDLHWVAGAPPTLPLRCAAKTRYRQPDQACALTLSPAHLAARFDLPQRAVTPGQSVVFYQGEECLGGGVIQRALAAVDASPPDSLAARA